MSHAAAILARFEAGEISREIALAQILLGGEVPDPAILPAPVAELAHQHRDRLAGLAALARAGFEADGHDQIAGVASLFDRLAESAPEAGVAFYSLGDPVLLAAATDEVVGVISSWAPVEGRDILDFGCGIGRVAIALAPRCATVTGLDLSAGMVAQATRRATGLTNTRFTVGDGATLPFPDGSFDLIVAADCMPFVVRAGDAAMASLFGEFRRVLRAGGYLMVFNWSYRGDPERDVNDAVMLARAHGFTLLRAGERPFAIWDGTGFQFRLGR